VGDPDNGHDLVILPFAGRLYLLRLPSLGRHLRVFVATRTTSLAPQKQRR
jgi:hypothetical protein